MLRIVSSVVEPPTQESSANGSSPSPGPSPSDDEFESAFPAFLEVDEDDTIVPFDQPSLEDLGYPPGAESSTVETASGAIVPGSALPIDGFLGPLLEESSKPNAPKDLQLVGSTIASGSRALARLLKLKEPTISAHLAKRKGITVPEVHIQLAIPFLGRTVLSKDLTKALLSEADTSLLTRDRRTLTASLRTLDKAERDINRWGPFSAGIGARDRKRAIEVVRKRITGNAEILRLEQLEDVEF